MIGEVLGGAGGAIGGAINLINGFHGGQAEEQKAVDILMKLKDPSFDPRQIPWQDLQVFKQFYPEVYDAVVPDDVKLAQDSQEGRGAQVRSLGYLEQVRDQGLPLQDQIAANQSADQLSGELARNNEGIVRDMAQRGRAGGGEEWAARLGGSQQATDFAAQEARNLAEQSMANRIQAAYGAGNAGGALRSGDVAFSQNAADAINRFNEMKTGRQMEAAAAAAGTRNQAGAERAATAQRIGEANVQGRYENAWQNIQRQDQNELAAKQFALRKAQAQAAALQQQAQMKNLLEARKQQQIVGIGQGAGKAVGGGLELGGLF